MVDIHNHLLYGIDDGSKSLEDSLDILKDMEKQGFTDIILTPHYIKDSKYSNPRDNNIERLNYLKEKLNENNIHINLFLGNEIFIEDNIIELLDSNQISSLNNTNYLLIELPMSGEYPGYQEVFKHLITSGYRVVLAHPERYISFQEDFDKIYELEDIGVYFQGNIDSLVGKYGPTSEKMIIRLLKENKLVFLATDIHQKKHDYKKWNEARNKALKYISKDVYDTLTRINPSKLIY
jgi:protein-tyrosine phosphatase